jgi:ribosomal subunit interface protein
MRPPKDVEATDTSRITVSGHQMDVGDALREYATTQLANLAGKFFGGAEDMVATFNKTGNGGFLCSVRVHAGRSYFDGKAEAREPHAAFNEALEHVAKQLRRLKRELREDKAVNPTKEGLL